MDNLNVIFVNVSDHKVGLFVHIWGDQNTSDDVTAQSACNSSIQYCWRALSPVAARVTSASAACLVNPAKTRRISAADEADQDSFIN